MANTRIRTRKIRNILSMYAEGQSIARITAQVGVSRNTVKKYLREFRPYKLTPRKVEKLSLEELEEMIAKMRVQTPNRRLQTLERQLPGLVQRYKQKGTTRDELWQVYKKKYSSGFELSQFKFHFAKWLKRK